ncbi:complex I subunit 5 family protein [Beijerinckia mobilis]|uniref:complex I subunit 5 family protein n=1 Tax=Beijerinckia mobilis TaxID=231434 RepID=UPI000552AD04|nr:proton-conducting transporter membrane subunit [Beijerinckia mobilis]
MVASLLHPLTIFILGLGGGFVLPLVYRLGKTWLKATFFLALSGMALVSALGLVRLLLGGDAIDILTAGSLPPVSISLRFGLWEGFFTASVNCVALLGALRLWPRLSGRYAAMLLYLIFVMGINGMVMTRDLFNLFVFLEIVSIGTYGLLSLEETPAALAAAFKYIMATVLASTFFLLATGLLYYATGTLNIDGLLAQREAIGGPIGAMALLLLLGALLVELKPFPANGWGLDVYETATDGVAALVSVGVSAGVFFALFKLEPLFAGQRNLIAWSCGLTFVAANLIGLRQRLVQRLLGYSSIGQMALMVLALVLLRRQEADGVESGGADVAFALVIGGLFLNHLLAKAGLFWLAGAIGAREWTSWPSLAGRPLLLLAFAILLVAIAGLPPFPGFWGKWELVNALAGSGDYGWIVLILFGSLCEAVYLFRWFGACLQAPRPAAVPAFFSGELPVLVAALLLVIAGLAAAGLAGISSFWLFLPLAAGAALAVIDPILPGQVKCALMLALVLAGGLFLSQGLDGMRGLFAALLLSGGLVIASAGFYRTDARPFHHALLAVLLLALPALLRAETGLDFFVTFEIITLASYFLIARSPAAAPHLLPFLLFSLAAAFFLLTGFAAHRAASGTDALTALGSAGADGALTFVLLASGFLIKAGALGVHVWLPGAYAEAEDDVSALLSAVISKVPIIGLLTGAYLAIRSQNAFGLAHGMGWIGLLTVIGGAAMALREDDVKRMLAYSSMSQLGYIVIAIALMSHIGWVTALYLVANHLMVKGILFLAVAGVTLRAGSRQFADLGGLMRSMPFTFVAVLIAVIAMSGLPPLMGFGGKWLLVQGMADQEWYALAVLSLVATGLGFLYMIRLVHGLFLKPQPPNRAELSSAGSLREAPIALLLPQYALAAAILLLSFYPSLVMEPIAAAIDPAFSAGLVWRGMSLQEIYGYWNPRPLMIVIVAAVMSAIALLAMLYWFRRKDARFLRSTGGKESDALSRFFAFYEPMLGVLVRPMASRFWNNVARGVEALGCLRRVYDGDGQTYALYVLYYFLALYFLGSAIPI